MDRRLPTRAGRRAPWSFPRTLGEQAREAIEERAPATAMLLGVTGLVARGPVVQLVAALDHPQPRALAFRNQRELDQHGVAGYRLLAGRLIPTEREALWRLDGLHDDRVSVALHEQHAAPAWFELELRALGEPLADLVGLGDGLP